MHLHPLLLFPILTLSTPLHLEPKSSHISIILTTLSGGPANYTLALAPNTWTSTSNDLSISKIYSQGRSLNLLTDCKFKFFPAPAHAARPAFVKEVDGSVTVGPPQPIEKILCKEPTCKATYGECGNWGGSDERGSCCDGNICAATRCRAIG